MKIEPFVAIVGIGSWGKNHVRNFYEKGALHGIFDIDTQKLFEISKNYPGIKIFKKYDDVLSDEKVKGVVIATPSFTHYELTKKALLCGKDVLCEKPMCRSSEEGEELLRLSEEKNKILMVGHIMQYHPAIKKIHELIEKGELGKILYIYSNRLNLGKVRKEENILWSFAPHDIAIILRLLKEEPFEVSAKGAYYLNPSVADTTITFLSFSSGVKAHIFVSWLHPYKEHRLVVIGEHGMVVFNDTLKEDKLIFYRHNFRWIQRLAVPISGEVEKVEFEREEPMKIQTQEFIHCVLNRKKPLTDVKEGLKIIKILELCEASLRKHGMNIEVNEKDIKKKFFLHQSSYIDEDVSIGEGTKIWHFSHIMKKAKIGENCILGQNVFVGEGVEIGNFVKIENGAQIFKGVQIEDEVFIGPNVTFTNVKTPRSFIERKHEFENTIVRKGATIGANSTILCGVDIGKYAFVAAGAVVTKNVPSHALVVGIPAKTIGWVCICGKKLSVSAEKKEFEVQCDYCNRIIKK